MPARSSIPYRACLTLLWLTAAGFAGNDLSRSGGATTVDDESRDAFSLPAANLPQDRRAEFFVGNSFFNQNWVAAPASAAARDGLGPLFNTRSCSTCHFKDGRGSPPQANQPFHSMLMRISAPGVGEHGAPKPDPVYGDQIQNQALPGIPPEADVFVDYTTLEGTFADGEPYALRKPAYRLEHLGYGALVEHLRMSPRVAPPVFGAGLLETVPKATLRAMEDPEDRDGDGISGRLNLVWDLVAQKPSIGRFGWKAEQPSVLQQVASAFHADMGLTTTLFPQENHSPAQTACEDVPNGGSPEVSDKIFQSVTFYCRTLAVPAARNQDDPKVVQGRRLFESMQCAACHTPEFVTGESAEIPELSRQTIRPYTDLLLHDMGADLSDDRPAFKASGREWRTPPLWGIGLVPKVNGHSTLLHDGRARNLTEAILWHGGEAEASREAFRKAPKADREALIEFLKSL